MLIEFSVVPPRALPTLSKEALSGGLGLEEEERKNRKWEACIHLGEDNRKELGCRGWLRLHVVREDDVRIHCDPAERWWWWSWYHCSSRNNECRTGKRQLLVRERDWDRRWQRKVEQRSVSSYNLRQATPSIKTKWEAAFWDSVVELDEWWVFQHLLAYPATYTSCLLPLFTEQHDNHFSPWQQKNIQLWYVTALALSLNLKTIMIISEIFEMINLTLSTLYIWIHAIVCKNRK